MIDDRLINQLAAIEGEKVSVARFQAAGMAIAIAAVAAAAFGWFPVIGLWGTLAFGASGAAMAYLGHRRLKALVKEIAELNRDISISPNPGARIVEPDIIRAPSSPVSAVERSPDGPTTSR